MMSFSLSGGVEVLGFISPTDPLDTYPVIDPIYGIDGFRNVDLISDLDLIPNPRRRAGMVVGVSGGTQYYKLNPSPWNGDITDWSVFNLGGLEILPFTSINNFPPTGSTNYLYLDQTESNLYAWDTSILPAPGDYALLNSSNPPLPPDDIPLTFAKAATVGVLSNNPVYYNGPSNDGVGAIISGSTNGLISDTSAPGRIDYIYTGTSGDTILIKNQVVTTNPLTNKGFQNGLYTIINPGSNTTPYILSRVSGFDQSSELYPLQVNVLGGSNNNLKYFLQTTVNPTIGTSNIVFSISSTQNITYQISFVDTSTSTALPACDYASGTTYSTIPGIGATLTAQSVGGPLIIDSLSASTSTTPNNTFNRVLVKDQTGPLAYQNGDYVVINPGSASARWQLRRINTSSGGFNRYTRFFIVSNTQSSKAGKLYFTTKNVPPLLNTTIGSDPINIVEYGGSGGTFTGGTVSGSTNFISGLTANTISATTFTANTETIVGRIPTGATGSVSTGTSPVGVYVQGRYSYVVNVNSSTLQIFDVSTPSSPVLVGSVSTGTAPRKVYVQGRYAYVVAGSIALQIFDVSNPSLPVLVGSPSTGLNGFDIYVQGRYTYTINTSSNLLQIFDVSNPSLPFLVGSSPTNSNSLSLYVQGRYAYVVNSNSNTLQIFDVSNPSSPSLVATVSTGSVPYGVYVQGRYAYVVNVSSGTLQIFNISNPSSPTSVGSVSTGSSPVGVYVQGRYAYVVNGGSNTLQIFDVSNPSSPVSVGTVSTGLNPNSVYVQGRYAYVVNPNSNTLQIFDVGGSYIQQLEAGGILTSTLESVGNATIGNDLAVVGGLNVSQSTNILGNLSATNMRVVSGLTATTISATTYQNLPSSTNIYNTDGTLTGARSVNLSGNQLTFSSSTTGTNVIGLYGSGNTATSRTYFEMGQRNNGGFSSSVFFTSFAPNYSDTSWGSFYSGSSMLSAYHENPVTTGGFGNLFFDISQFGSTVANRYFAWHAAPVLTARSLSTEMMRLHILGNGDGNLGINTKGVPTQKLHVSGNTLIEGSLSARTATISGNSQNILSVIGSGNSTTSPLFTVQGSSGELFSVSDSLVGSLFSVNDISGLPIVEVFSDNTMLVGSYQSPSLNTTVRKTLTGGTNTIYSIPTSAYTGAFFDYTLISSGSTGARAGTIMSIWSGSTAQFTETPTTSIGSTTDVTFSVGVSGGNAVLSSSATTAGWLVKTIVRSI
jgi:hypothetical protein